MNKTLVALMVLAGMAFSSGCATPAYSARERGQLIARNWGYEWAQVNDDVDSLLLLRPAGNLTIWHVR